MKVSTFMDTNKKDTLLKIEQRKRLLLDMAVDDIILINNQLNAYEKYMSPDNFDTSKEVDELYSNLDSLIKIDAM